MTPLTRKENYLNEIVGWGETAPEKPLTPEEFFFAAILGEAVQVPDLSNASRYELFLAKIAGYNVNVSPPTYTSPHLEFFLAKAAGMDVETPTPQTREEIFWSNYSAIVDFEVEGVPPLTYKAIEGTLENYRIYGNTVGGESVGDRTGNLFDKNLCIEHAILSQNGDVDIADAYAARVSDFIPVTSNNSYTINNTGSIRGKYYKGDYSAYQVSDFDFQPNQNSNTFVIPESVKYIRFTINNAVGVESVMLCEGSTLLPYEPYGYRVPVTVTNGTGTQTTNIYLPEQIRKVGDEAEYLDYGEQKMHRVRKNLLQNTATSQTLSGVTVTVNEDGSVTCNGTASKAIYFSFVTNLESGTYIISGTPRGMTETNAIIFINANYSTIGLSGNVRDNDGNGKQFVATQSGTATITITIKSGYTCENLTFYPMIRKADIEDDTYEPYIENVDLDVTLPALPTLTGTNVLSVGTAVQPSKVYVKYKGERQ